MRAIRTESEPFKRDAVVDFAQLLDVYQLGSQTTQVKDNAHGRTEQIGRQVRTHVDLCLVNVFGIERSFKQLKCRMTAVEDLCLKYVVFVAVAAPICLGSSGTGPRACGAVPFVCIRNTWFRYGCACLFTKCQHWSVATRPQTKRHARSYPKSNTKSNSRRMRAMSKKMQAAGPSTSS